MTPRHSPKSDLSQLNSVVEVIIGILVSNMGEMGIGYGNGFGAKFSQSAQLPIETKITNIRNINVIILIGAQSPPVIINYY